MKVVEFRICMPLKVEEYQKCQLYLVTKGTLEDAEQRIKNAEKYGSENNSVGVVILKNESYVENYTSGQYTLKKLNILHKMPKWLLNFVDKKYCTIEEQCWNAYPYIKTIYQSSGFPKGKIQLESSHHSGFDTEYNALNLSEDLLNIRKIIYIDIVNDKVSSKEYNINEDPSLFLSQKTGRGHFKQNWKETSEHLMTCYKLITLDIPYFGLFCSKIENWIISAIRDNLLKYHRKAFCWIDEWFELKIEDIRKIEKDVQTKLKKFWTETGQDVPTDDIANHVTSSEKGGKSEEGESEKSEESDESEKSEEGEKSEKSEEGEKSEQNEERNRSSSLEESLTNEDESKCESWSNISDNENIKNGVNKTDKYSSNINERDIFDEASKNSMAFSSAASLNYKNETTENMKSRNNNIQNQNMHMNMNNLKTCYENRVCDLEGYEVIQGESEIENNELDENKNMNKENFDFFDEGKSNISVNKILVDNKKKEIIEYFFFKKNKNEYGEYLYKISDGMFYSWKYRYFSIKDNKLYYYINDEKNDLKGEINLLNAQIHWIGEYKGRNNVFVIQCFYKNVYYLSIDDEIQAKKCMIDIQMASLINETNNSKNNVEKQIEYNNINNIKVEDYKNLMNIYNDVENSDNIENEVQPLNNLNGKIKNENDKLSYIFKKNDKENENNVNNKNGVNNHNTLQISKNNKYENIPITLQLFNNATDKKLKTNHSWIYDNDSSSSSSSCDECASPLLGDKSRNRFESFNLKNIINMLFGNFEGIEIFKINKDIQYKGVKELLHKLKIDLNTNDELNYHLKKLFIFKKKRGKKIEYFLYIILIFLFFIFFHKILNFLFYFFIPIFFFFWGVFIYNDKISYSGFCNNVNYNVYKYSFTVNSNINFIMSILLNKNKINKGEYYQNVIQSKNKYIQYVCSFIYLNVPIFKQIYEFYRPRKFFMTKYLEKDVREIDKINDGSIGYENFVISKSEDDKKKMRCYFIVQYTSKHSKEYFNLINCEKKIKDGTGTKYENRENRDRNRDENKDGNNNFSAKKMSTMYGISTSIDKQNNTLNNNKYNIDFSSKKMSNIILEMSRTKLGKLIQNCILGLLKHFFKIIKNTFFDEYVKGEGFDIYIIREKGDEICNIEYLTCYDYKSGIFNNYLNVERCRNVIRLFMSNSQNNWEKCEIDFENDKNNFCIDENEENIKLLINKKKDEKEICRNIFFNINNKDISKNIIKYIYNLTRIKYVNTNKYIGLIKNINDIFFIINLSKVFIYLTDKIELHEIKNIKIIEKLTNRHSDLNFYSDDLFINNVIYILSGIKLLHNTFEKSWVFPKKNEKIQGKYNNSYIVITMINESPITFSILTENYKTKTKLYSNIQFVSDSTMSAINIFINNDIIIKNNNNYELKISFPNISLIDLIKGNLRYTFCNNLAVTDSLGNLANIKFIDKYTKCGQFCGIAKRNETITNTLSGNIFDKIIIDDDKKYNNMSDIEIEMEYDDDSNSARLSEHYIKVRTLMEKYKTKL
ncbi:hypothetical protein YYC_00289 [Plasmodium yoelii 17X]|uniref:PH domain-containing protein n=2 Tax=Plasmodium yoelii 17X TaxID=1323249 RepID=V7PTV3_PLAYE|nr:hypothetical protein YYC_00289 [Plasmodium yoelii 17X]